MARLKIKEVAEAKGIIQSRLQIMAAVTPPLLNRYWNNKTSTVSLDDLAKIARALGVHPGDLLDFDETEDQPSHEEKDPEQHERK